MNQTNPLGVLSGEKALKFNIAIDYTTIGMLVGGLFLAVLAALVIYKKI